MVQGKSNPVSRVLGRSTRSDQARHHPIQVLLRRGPIKALFPESLVEFLVQSGVTVTNSSEEPSTAMMSANLPASAISTASRALLPCFETPLSAPKAILTPARSVPMTYITFSSQSARQHEAQSSFSRDVFQTLHLNANEQSDRASRVC